MELNEKYKHSELTNIISGVFYEVYNELGFGFLESVYRKSFRLALIEKGLVVEEEVATPVYFRGEQVGGFKAGNWPSLQFRAKATGPQTSF